MLELCYTTKNEVDAVNEKVELNSVNVWSDGKLQLAVNLCEKIGIRQLFDNHLQKSTGRPSDIPPGIEAEIMIASMCDEGYRPLSALQNYYKYKDLEGIFHYPIQLSQLNDDRFGNFLDDFYEAGCRKIFMEASSLAFTKYGLAIRNINYDTTSKVMWGEYETTNHLEDDGVSKTSYISIDFGYSKDKRNDKKQIKIGIGTANGIVVDAKVLSGNMDDKTYNKENLEDLDCLLTQMKVNRDEFYYIADSALFTETNIEKAGQNDIRFITRMPDNTTLAKEFLATPLPEDAQIIEIENAQGKTSIYKLIETEAKYKGHLCKFAVIYSHVLEETKQKTCQKQIKKEKEKIQKSLKKYKSHAFKCQADAEKEIEILNKKLGSKAKFHNIEFTITEIKKNRPGRPSNNSKNDIARVEAVVYLLLIALMILTIAEKVIRDGLKKKNELVYGIDRRKLKRPTLTAILQIMERIRVITYKVNGKTKRQIRNLDDSCRKIIDFLGLSENSFAWNGD